MVAAQILRCVSGKPSANMTTPTAIDSSRRGLCFAFGALTEKFGRAGFRTHCRGGYQPPTVGCGERSRPLSRLRRQLSQRESQGESGQQPPAGGSVGNDFALSVGFAASSPRGRTKGDGPTGASQWTGGCYPPLQVVRKPYPSPDTSSASLRSAPSKVAAATRFGYKQPTGLFA